MKRPPSYRMKSRMVIVLVSMIIFGFCIIIHSLFTIQIVQGKEMQAKALGQQLRSVPIEANRGSIYDTNGKMLAKSATVYRVCLDPLAIKGTTGDKEIIKKNRDAVADCLYQILGLDKTKMYAVMDKTYSQYEIVKTNVEKNQADELLKYIEDNGVKGIFLQSMTRRYYPYGNFAAAVLGFTNNDGVGAYGLESYYDKVLMGTPGRVVSLRNRDGVTMTQQHEQVYDAQDGNSLVLTLDETIQHYLEKNLEIAVKEHKVRNRVCGIVMDVKTGAVLAMATKPDFDPNDPYTIFDEEMRTELEEMNRVGEEAEKAYSKARGDALYAQWRNKAISDPYEPGSVFKIITLAGALESGAITENSSFYCPGYKDVAGRRQHCWIWSSRQTGHGQQTLAEAVKNSCNPAFIEIGQLMGVKRFLEYFDNFGLTQGTDIDLPGEANSIYHTTMNIADLSSSAFGQTNKLTPIQLITACNAAVNGGKLMQPYIVRQVVDKDGKVVSTTEPVVKRQVVSEEISKQVALILEQVVQDGSGKQAKIPGYRVGGKTGTSEKIAEQIATGKSVNILSFYGFAPVDDPQVACLVLLDEPDLYNAFGSTIAAPIVGSILSEVLPYMGIEPKYTEEELAATVTTTPNILNLDIHEAESKLRVDGLKFRVIGNGTKVLRQIPGATEPVPNDGTIVIYTEEVTEDDMVEIPDVLGKSPEEANTLLAGKGLNIRIYGDQVEGASLRAIIQTPSAGEKVATGTVVNVTFEEVAPPAE